MKLLLATAALLFAPSATRQPASASFHIDDIAWRVSLEGDRTNLTISRAGNGGGTSVSVALADVPVLAQAIASGANRPVAFILAREPGTTRCSGTIAGGKGGGSCRFIANPAFERGLIARNLAFGTRANLLGMALVGVTLGLADDLRAAGLPAGDADDLTAAAALDITGGYARELKDAGLVITDFDDLIACKALGVDTALVRDMAAAGYAPLTAEQAIGMRAVGVTPDYARQMKAALGGTAR